MLRKFWLYFAQAVTVCLAVLFVVSTLRPDLLSWSTRSTAPIAKVAAPVAVVELGEPYKAGPGWSLKTSIERAPGYRWPLYQVLKAAHLAGQPCPNARDVLHSWTLKPPPDVQVMPDGVKYNDGLGNLKEANLKAIQQAIKNLLKPRAGQAPANRRTSRTWAEQAG